MTINEDDDPLKCEGCLLFSLVISRSETGGERERERESSESQGFTASSLPICP